MEMDENPATHLTKARALTRIEPGNSKNTKANFVSELRTLLLSSSISLRIGCFPAKPSLSSTYPKWLDRTPQFAALDRRLHPPIPSPPTAVSSIYFSLC